MAEQKICVALVSGGIDSPVAVARMLAEGWIIHPLHCSQEPVTGPGPEQKTIALLQHLYKLQNSIGEAAKSNLCKELLVVPVTDALSKFTEKWNHTEYFIHMKRLFNSIASIHAKTVGATHVLTGENLGQVSSQTLGNLGAIELATELHPLRPLLAFDKVDIMHMARRLGTLEISEGPEVCDALGPDHPSTVANKEWIELSEQRLGGLQSLVDNCFANRKIVNLR